MWEPHRLSWRWSRFQRRKKIPSQSLRVVRHTIQLWRAEIVGIDPEHVGVEGERQHAWLPRRDDPPGLLQPAEEARQRPRSEENTSELPSLMRIQYAVF